MYPVEKVFSTLGSVAQHPLYRGHRLRAAVAFVWAQLVARARRGEVVVNFPNNTRLAVMPWVKGAAHYIFPRLCEFEEMSFVMHFLRPGELFLDVGANIGAYTVLAGGVAGAEVLAFEPSRRTFGQFKRNVELNDLADRVSGVNAALGREAGVLRLTDDLGTENYIVPDQAGGTEVPVVSLDSQLVGRKPVLLKVDVEGFETQVFAGAPGTLRAPSLAAMIVERNDSGARYGFNEEELHQTIRSAGFRPFAYSPFERCLAPLSPDAKGNLIYLRDPKGAEERLLSAKAFSLNGTTV